MIRYSIALALCATLVLGAAAFGSQGASFFGPTGLIGMPTADSLGMGQFRVFANYLTKNAYDEAPYGVNVGLGYGLEVGATQIHETGTNGGNTNIINVKYTAFKGNLVMPAVAVGAINVAENKDFLGSFINAGTTGKIEPFAVASKSFKVPGVADFSLHAGYIGGNLDRAMYGASMSISPKIELIADFIPNFSKFSIGARYNLPSGFGVQAASIDGDFNAGIAYTRALGQ